MRVTGLSPAEALVNAAAQFQLGFDVRGAFERRKRRKRVVTSSEGVSAESSDDGPEGPPSLDPPGA